jgi:hypothetical protein
MPAHDITRRFVIIYHNAPIDSFDDEASAVARMEEMKGTQLRSWRDRWPMHALNNDSLWDVQDMAKKALDSA